ncbi:30S ribosomal protein S9 [Candidatus Peregrinibacteria bacterium]|nr:MAG: 30S ribosomal protein S9 [Candidatus Peregrinibacteria bacterium]
MFSGKYSYAAGKRKTAIARVRVYTGGKDEIIINGKKMADYFPKGLYQGMVLSPLKTLDIKGYSITAKIIGGGMNAQADALRHGIAKALIVADPSERTTLKKLGHLTRDARIVERKKPGLRKARRAHQWVKR